MAVSIAVRHRVNLAAIRRWSVAKRMTHRFDEFRAELKAARGKRARRRPGTR